jgi:hypothetical protein
MRPKESTMPKGVLITDEQREEIKELLADDKTPKQVARKLHLSTTTIARVKNGKPTGKRSPHRYKVFIPSTRRTYAVLLHLTLDEINRLVKAYGPDILYKFRRPL